MRQKTAAILLLGTYMMNLFDLYATRYLLQFPQMWEWNPICRAALAIPGMFYLYKYAVFPVCLWCLYQFRQLPLAEKGIYLSSGVFFLNTVYQMTLMTVLM